MLDPKNEVEHCFVPIKNENAHEFQKLMAQYSSLRLLYEPDRRSDYIRFSYGGTGVDVSEFDREVQELGYHYEEPIKERRPWWKNLFSRNVG